MAIDTIKFKRGVKSKLNNLSYGEPAYISDENELYIGTEDGVEKITRNKEVAELSSQLEQNENDIDKLLNYAKEVRLDDFIEEGETTYDNAWVKAMTSLSNGGKLILPARNINFNYSVVCDVSNIEIEGVGGSTKLTFNTGGIEIGNTTQVDRIYLKNFKITSKTYKKEGTVGLNFNKNKINSNCVTDSIFENIHISNFDVGIQSYYIWCNEFRNIRIQPSNKCLSLQSQTNNIKFVRCSFCQYNKTSDCINLLGVSFYECSIEQSEAIFASLFQSYVSFITPYYEFIPGIAAIGSANESSPSHLTVIGGYGACDINVYGHRQMVSVINCEGKLNVNTSGWYSMRKPIIQNINTSAGYRNPIFELRSNRLTYSNSKCVLNRDGNLVFGNNAQEYFKISSLCNLEEGEYYTLVYSVRGNGNMRMLRSGTGINIPILPNTEEFELIYSTFIHDGKDFSIAFLTDNDTKVELQYLGLYKGQYFEDIQLNNNAGYVGYSRTKPNEGDWILGDKVINNNPTVGSYEGWVCIESGSPGVWKGFGLIEE